MKLIHISDLHLGKRIYEVSLLDDQRHILRQIARVVRREQPDGVLIAGDVYDQAVPSAEAVALLDAFLCALSGYGTQVFVISGNHDSPERLSFGAALMNASGVHIAPVYAGTSQPVTLRDAFGDVDVFMLPFIKPAHVRRYFPDAFIASQDDAVRVALSALPVREGVRSVLLSHQFVTGAQKCESEELNVGGSDNVDASAYDAFDYVALGHIHGPQRVGRDTLRYCGTPLKYSFSEIGQQKSITVADMRGKGEVIIRTIPLEPVRDMRQIRGRFLEVSAPGFDARPEDYLRVILTDENDVPDAASRLRTLYPNLMRLEYDNARTRGEGEVRVPDSARRQTPMELYEELYQAQNNQPMTDEQRQIITRMIAGIWGDEP